VLGISIFSLKEYDKTYDPVTETIHKYLQRTVQRRSKKETNDFFLDVNVALAQAYTHHFFNFWACLPILFLGINT
jgi:uncharacterized protein YgbK (DUF1537 family)